MIADIIGWIATIFRASGMLAGRTDMVKYLISIGNLFWMINGILSRNIPLIVSNAICLGVMIVEIINMRKEKRQLIYYVRMLCAYLTYYILILPYIPIGLIGLFDEWLNNNRAVAAYERFVRRIVKPIIPNNKKK